MGIDCSKNVGSSQDADSDLDAEATTNANSIMDVDSIQSLITGISTLSVDEHSQPPPSQKAPLSLSDMSPEIRNQIYAKCKFFFVEVSRPNEPAIFTAHPTLTQEIADYYYSQNTFMLNTRVKGVSGDETSNERRVHFLSILRNWSSRLSDRHAGMIKHIRLITFLFTAEVHIPQPMAKDSLGCYEPIAVTFTRTKECPTCCDTVRLAQRVTNFYLQLRPFNEGLAGRRLTSTYLESLVCAILTVAPCFCPDVRGRRLPSSGDTARVVD